MVPPRGIEPLHIGLQPIALPTKLERLAKAVGIEPTLRGLESLVLPLHQADVPYRRIELRLEDRESSVLPLN